MWELTQHSHECLHNDVSSNAFLVYTRLRHPMGWVLLNQDLQDLAILCLGTNKGILGAVLGNRHCF